MFAISQPVRANTDNQPTPMDIDIQNIQTTLLGKTHKVDPNVFIAITMVLLKNIARNGKRRKNSKMHK
jgi:hypothetical protein